MNEFMCSLSMAACRVVSHLRYIYIYIFIPQWWPPYVLKHITVFGFVLFIFCLLILLLFSSFCDLLLLFFWLQQIYFIEIHLSIFVYLCVNVSFCIEFLSSWVILKYFSFEAIKSIFLPFGGILLALQFSYYMKYALFAV